jgi:hypothetical protein
MENIIISIFGVILLFVIAIFATNWKEKKEDQKIDTSIRTKKTSSNVNSSGATSGSGGKGYIGTIDKNSEKVKPKKKTPKAKASKPEFPITDNKPKPGAKRGRKPKKDKGNDLLLS